MTITRTTAVTVTLVAVGTALAGCSSGSSGTSPAAQSVSTVVVTSTETPASGPPSSTSTSPTEGASSGRCRADELTGTLAPSPGGASAGSDHFVLTLTNSGTQTCTVNGFPGVSFVGDGTGTQLGAAARRNGSAGRTVTLMPTDGARADLTVAQAGNYPDCSPQTADGLRVYPPDDRDSLFVRTSDLTACRSSAVLLTVGPLR